MYDHAASQVRKTFTPAGSNWLLQRKCACNQHTTSGRECEECRQKRESTLQRAAVNVASTNSVPPIVHDVLSSPGQSLDAGTRAFVEPRFGHDFSGVKVHTDARAAESARSVNALAYTVGGNVVFGTGQYAPGTSEGRRLLAHELTHVVQQASSIFSLGNISSAEDLSEREADSTASAILDGQHLTVRPTMPIPFLQRASGTGDTTRQARSQRGSRKRKSGVHSITLRIPPPPPLHIPVPRLHLDPLDKPDLSRLPRSIIERYRSEKPAILPPNRAQSTRPEDRSVPRQASSNDDEKARIAPQVSAEVERDIGEGKTATNLQFSLIWKNVNLRELFHKRLELFNEPNVSIQSSFETANLPGISNYFKSFATQTSVNLLNVHVLQLYGDDIIELALVLGAGLEVGKEGDVDLKGSVGLQPQIHIGRLKVQEFEIPNTDVSLYLSVSAEPSVHLRQTGGGKSANEGIFSFGEKITGGLQIQF